MKICYCIDCHKKLSRIDAKRCKSCAKKGNLHPYFKTGKFIQKIFNCIECNQPITHMASKGLCHSCSQMGERNKSFKGGKPKCLDCKKQLTNSNVKRCRPCYRMWRREFPKSNPMYGKSASWKRIQYKEIWMRSTWEIAYAKYLDKQGIKWLYEPKTFDLGETTYTPDFYLPKTNEYIEIKGWMRKDSNEKINLFIKKYNNLIVLRKKELKELQII